MEETILAAEAELEKLEQLAASPELAEDHQKATATYTALSEVQERVKTLYARWAELDEIG